MGKIIETLLEILQGQAENTVDLIDIFTSDRSTSYKKARRSLRYGPPAFKKDWAYLYRERQKFYSLLNKLKREGLIKQQEKKRGAAWAITKRGLERLRVIKAKPEAIPKHNYEAKAGNEIIIISFDIPEKERKKRYWLRAALVGLGFKKLQQSVWVGKVKIPPDFFTDLRQQNILSCVHICSLGKTGTISEKHFS